MAKKKKQKEFTQAVSPKAASGSSYFEGVLASRYYVLYYALFIFILTIILFSEFVFSDKMLFSSDGINASLYFRQFWKDHFVFPCGIPLWSPLLFGGMPFVDAFHSDIFYPLTLPFKLLMPIPRAFGWAMLFHVFLAGLFMYLCARAFGLSKLASSTAGVFYMFAPYLVSMVQPGHDGKMYVTALLPLAMLFLERGLNQKKFLDFTLLGAAVGLIILTPHPQMSYFTLWALGFYFGFRMLAALLKEKKNGAVLKPIFYFIIAVGLGLAISAIQFYPSYKYVKLFSPRAEVKTESAQTEAERYAYATSWAMNAEELVAQFIPNFVGNNAKKISESGEAPQTYWGRNAFKDNSEYIGILPIFLGLLAVIFVRKLRTWFFLGLGIFALIYALGASTPFFKIFYYLIPNVKHLRAPSMIIFLFSFSFCLLAGFGLDFIQNRLREEKPERKKKIFLFGALVAGLYLLLALIFTFSGKGIMRAAKSIFYPAGPAQLLEYRMFPILRDIVIGLWILAIVLIIVYFIIRAYGRKALGLWILGIIAFLGMADAWRMDFKFLTTVDPEQFFAEKRLVKHITNTDNKYFDRILNADRGVLRSSNYFAYHEIPMMFGYHGNQMKIYDQYWNRQGKSNDHSFIYHVSSDSKNQNMGRLDWLNMSFIGMAGVKYLVTDFMTDPAEYIDSLQLVSAQNEIQSDGLVLYEFPEDYGRLRIYHDFALFGSHEDALAYMREMRYDWRKQVVLENDPGIQRLPLAESGGESAEITSYGTEEIEIDINLNNDGLIYLADCYYPAWKAYVDGLQTPVLLANGAFRAVPVPAGKHQLVFRYESETYNMSRVVSIAGSLFVVCLLALNLFTSRRKGSGPLE